MRIRITFNFSSLDCNRFFSLEQQAFQKFLNGEVTMFSHLYNKGSIQSTHSPFPLDPFQYYSSQ